MGGASSCLPCSLCQHICLASNKQANISHVYVSEYSIKCPVTVCSIYVTLIIALKSICSHLFELMPSICIRSSALKRRDASCSESVPLCEHSESISSMNIVLGELNLAWNRSGMLCVLLQTCSIKCCSPKILSRIDGS